MSSPEIINFANELRDQLRRYMNDITDSLATGSAKTFDQYQRQVGQIEGLADTLGQIGVSVGKNSGDVKTAVGAALAKAATGGNILTRATGSVINPNMELLFKGPQLRTFGLTWKMSPRDYEESEMIKKIIRMFKQSQAVKRSKSLLFLESPNTYALRFLTARGKEHSSIE